MIATNSHGTDYIDERYRFLNEVVADSYLSEIKQEQIICRYEKRMYWLGRLGAVVGFCRWPGDGRYYLTLKYWRVDWLFSIAKLHPANGPMVILAGFMSEARGRHWKRKIVNSKS